MYDFMDRSAIKALWKRGKKYAEIAREMCCDRRTVKRIVHEPLEKEYKREGATSQVDIYKDDILKWLNNGVSVTRMLELVREDKEHPYQGGRNSFYERVKLFKSEWKKEQQEGFVRFEGIPGEYLQVDWGQVNDFSFIGQEKKTINFFAARLKYSRYSYVEFQPDQKQEHLIRSLLRVFEDIGGIPWVVVFDNMKTVTTGRDRKNRPIWNKGFIKFAVEMEFHPDVCWPYSGNQKGSVENLVGWVKENFLSGREFIDDKDLSEQCKEWLNKINNSKSQAHGAIPTEILQEERSKFTPLLTTADDYGLYREVISGKESLVMIENTRYSIPVKYIGQVLTARVREKKIDFYDGCKCIATHERRSKQWQPVIEPSHYEEVFEKKPRARVMVYRDFLMAQDKSIKAFITELCRRYKGTFGEQIIEMYHMWQTYGTDELGVACALASEHGAYGSDYLESLLRTSDKNQVISSLTLVDVPSQEELDRTLLDYECRAIGGGK